MRRDVFEYSVEIVLGRTSANIKINIEINGIIKYSDIILLSRRNIVKNEDANTFEKLIPIRIKIKVWSLSSINLDVYFARILFCFFHTFICSGFDFINEISADENNIDNKTPIDEYNNRKSDIDIIKIK